MWHEAYSTCVSDGLQSLICSHREPGSQHCFLERACRAAPEINSNKTAKGRLMLCPSAVADTERGLSSNNNRESTETLLQRQPARPWNLIAILEIYRFLKNNPFKKSLRHDSPAPGTRKEPPAPPLPLLLVPGFTLSKPALSIKGTKCWQQVLLQNKHLQIQIFFQHLL